MPLFPFLIQLSLILTALTIWIIASWGWPVVVVVLMPMFFPLYLVKFSFHGIPLTLAECFIYVGFAVHFIKRFYMGWRHHARVFDFRATTLWIPISLLLLSVVTSLFIVPTSADQREVFGILKGWFIVPIMYFYLVLHVLPGTKSVRRCLEWYAISATLLSLWGISQRILGSTITPDGRVSGPFASANYLALYIMPAIIFVVIRLWHIFFVPKEYTGVVQLFMKVFHAEEKISYPAVIRYTIGGLIMLAALYFTRSFGAFLGLFAALVSYGIYHWFFSFWRMERRTAVIRVVIFTLAVTLLTSAFFVTGDPGKFKQMFNLSGQSSSSVRLEVWTVAKQFIVEHPVFGIGPGRFEDEYAKRAPAILAKAPYESQMLHPHNLYLMFWLSAGLLGLISFLWLIALLFHTVFAIEQHDGRKRMAVIGAAMLVGILVHGLVDTPIWKNDLALQFWMIAGIIARLRYRA